MYERYTDRARKVMQLANQEAQRFNHEYIGTEHILLGLVKEGSGVAANVLKNLDADLRKIRIEVEKIVQAGPDMVTGSKLPQTPRAKKVCEYAIEEARNLNHNYVGTEHLLLGLVREQEGVAAQVLMNLGLRLKDLREEVFSLLGVKGSERDTPRPWSRSISKTPALDAFGHDLTELAGQGKLDPAIERQPQLQALAAVLGCREKRNALLVGEAGVGKKALVRDLAHAMAFRAVPDWLERCRLVELSFGRQWRQIHDDAAEEQLKAVRNEVRRAGNMILFLPDELRWMTALEGSTTASEFYLDWLEALLRSEVRCILVGTPGEYQKALKHFLPLEQCCQVVPVPPATRDETLAIVRGLAERYETHHLVRFTHDALAAVAELADRYLPGALPGKALLLLDHAGARGRGKGADATREVREKLARLTEQVDRLNQDKEDAVAQQVLDRAAELRDRADRLKKQREALVNEEKHLRQVNGGTIEAADVADTLAQMTGSAPPADGVSFVAGPRTPGDGD